MSKKYLYLEGASGISGDMTVASLLDLGASQEKLNHVLQSLQLEGFRQVISRGQSYGMDGCVFDVLLESDEVHTPHESGHAAAHSTDHEDHHHHHHDHHEEPHRHHEHRNLADVYAVIDRGEMSDRANALAKRIFLIVSIPNISWCPPKGTFSPWKTVVQGGSFLHAHLPHRWVIFTCRSTP